LAHTIRRHLGQAKSNTLINELLLMRSYLFNIHPKLHHQKWQKSRVILPVKLNRRNMHRCTLSANANLSEQS